MLMPAHRSKSNDLLIIFIFTLPSRPKCKSILFQLETDKNTPIIVHIFGSVNLNSSLAI